MKKGGWVRGRLGEEGGVVGEGEGWVKREGLGERGVRREVG